MMMNNKNQPEINPELMKKINLLETTPQRNPELAAQSRKKYIAEVEALPFADTSSGLGWFRGLFNFIKKDGSTMNNGSRKFAVSTFAAILMVVVVLFGGASATAYASQSALPGDALYPVKTSLEQTQINLANDAYNQALLHLEFAQRRLNEIKELLAQGRTNDVEFASNEFEHYIQEAMKASQIVQAADAARGAEISKLVSQALLDYASALKSVLIAAPDAVKPTVERALLASQDGAGDEVEFFGVVTSISESEVEIDGVLYSVTGLTEFKDLIQSGDMVKVHVIMTQDGVMVIREIELSSGLDSNSNESTDDNGSESDDNMNDNESEDNSNEDDSNGNESEHNLNTNDSDDDMNENDSDNHSGGKSGSSNNDNDHDSNDNSGDNSNDNDSDDDGNSNESNSNDNEKDDD
jgi:hypothetical protein